MFFEMKMLLTGDLHDHQNLVWWSEVSGYRGVNLISTREPRVLKYVYFIVTWSLFCWGLILKIKGDSHE